MRSTTVALGVPAPGGLEVDRDAAVGPRLEGHHRDLPVGGLDGSNVPRAVLVDHDPDTRPVRLRPKGSTTSKLYAAPVTPAFLCWPPMAQPPRRSPGLGDVVDADHGRTGAGETLR